MTKTYIVVWNNVIENLESITSQVSNYSIINSDAPAQEGWNNLGLVWYYKQMAFAMNDFIENTDDNIFCWIAADAKSEYFNQITKRAEEVLSEDHNGIYAPYLSHEAWGQGTSSIMSIGDGMFYAVQTDGVYVYIKRDIVKIMNDYFKYLSSKETLEEMKSGWGVDYIWSALTIYLKKYIVRDSKYHVFHPEGSSYDHGKASHEMGTVMSRFTEFCKANEIDSKKIEDLFARIAGRMGGSNGCLTVDDFYAEQKIFNYAIMSINEKRLDNKINIRNNMFGSTENNISFVDASNPLQFHTFLKNYNRFRITNENFKVGEIGCFASHYIAWKCLANSDNESLLLFEDDAYINSDFSKTLSKYLDYLPEDWDVFSVYVDENQYDRHRDTHKVNDFISKSYQDWSTLCYIVSKRGAKKLIEYAEFEGINMPVDYFIFRNAEKGIFNAYTVKPGAYVPLSIRDTTGSLVQDTGFMKDPNNKMMYDFQKFLLDDGESLYSQIQQDKFALFILGKKPGFFVEFGACDGIYLSNTYLLEKEYGWNGILSEPAPSYQSDLKANRSVNIETLCVADATGKTMRFVEVGKDEDRGLSGLEDHAFYDHHSSNRKENGIVYDVETISLKDLLDKYNAPDVIDYLSIDTEGSELSILTAYDFSRHFKCISVEHNGTENRDKIYSLLSGLGYDRVLTEFSKWDDWYIKKDLL